MVVGIWCLSQMEPVVIGGNTNAKVEASVDKPRKKWRLELSGPSRWSPQSGGKKPW